MAHSFSYLSSTCLPCQSIAGRMPYHAKPRTVSDFRLLFPGLTSRFVVAVKQLSLQHVYVFG